VDLGRLKRRVRVGLPAVALTAAGLLAGCSSAGESGTGPGTSSSATSSPPDDPRNSTYSVTCDGLAPGGFPAKLVDGYARVPADVGQTPFYDYFDVRYEADAEGDIDGDGAPDTVVLLQCSPQPSNGIVEEVQVFAADGERIASLPSPTTLREGTVLAPLYDPSALSVDHGDIVAGMRVYEPADSHASGPSGYAVVRWHWDGRGFERVPQKSQTPG